VKLAKKLNLSAVFECSAKDNKMIDDIFFRSIINCTELYKEGESDMSTSAYRKNSASTVIEKSADEKR
jgi:hypothetical protein